LTLLAIKGLILRVWPDYTRFVIRDSSKLTFFIHIRFANNANRHIRQICIRHLIFVSIGINSLAIFLTKRTRITTNRAWSDRILMLALDYARIRDS